MTDKARGALLGAAVGDALGRPLEGHRAPSPADAAVAMTRRRLEWTDDTAMTLALGESIVEVGDVDEAHVLAAFVRVVREESHRPFGPGTLKFLTQVDEGKSPKVPRSWGNGAAMRVSPVAVFAGNDMRAVVELAERQARVTHTHPFGVDGAVLQATAVACALQGVRFRPVVPMSVPMMATLMRVLSVPKDEDPDGIAMLVGNGMDARTSVNAALAISMLRPDDFEDAMLFAMLLGGDTDTIASMTGAIVGARLGAEAIPAKWLDRLEQRERLTMLADALAGGA